MTTKTMFTSDTHFGHARIIELCARPFRDLAHMNEAMIENWNAEVGPNDTIFHLGDFAMGPKADHPSFFRRLNGHKVIVRGNHDQSHEKMIEMGWNEVCTHRYVDLDGYRLFLSHIPSGNDRPETPERYYKEELKLYPIEPYDYWLAGHVHVSWKRRGKVINVGVDQWNFRPVSLATLLTASE